jgi:hypothetical protein
MDWSYQEQVKTVPTSRSSQNMTKKQSDSGIESEICVKDVDGIL